MKKIKVMFYSDGFFGTSGYSRVGRELALRVAQDERFEVAYQETNNANPSVKYKNVSLFPCFFSRPHKMFINVVANHINMFKPHIFLPISDIFLLNRDNLNKIAFKQVKLVPYVMIDSFGLPDGHKLIMPKAAKIFTGSKFGQETLATGDYESDVLFHGVNFNQFKPIKKDLQNKLKESYGYKSTDKVFLNIGRNYLRKRPMRLIQAIATFVKTVPDHNAKFLFHMSDYKQEGWNLEEFIKRMEKTYTVNLDCIDFTENHMLGKGVEEKDITNMYNMCDFYLTASAGEGFGLPIVEAMACNKVVIAPDNTTHTHFLADGRGVLVKNDGFSYVGFGCSSELVDISDLMRSIQNACNMSPKDYSEMSSKGLAWVRQKCNWDNIINQLKDELIEVYENGKE